MSRFPRVLLALASGLLLLALQLPLWRVQLVAPQYPEGLGMVIDAHTVRGATEHDLGSINALNHYIGMKVIDPAAIPELRVMPWVIVGLAVLAAIAALVGSRRFTVVWLASFAALGLVGLWDFWKWEYTYGHDLDFAHAIIKVPGMSYQPPLIGSKQLLNFTATSWPASGTVLLGLAFAFGVGAIVLTRRKVKRAMSVAVVALAACGPHKPTPIAYHADACNYCRMEISDPRFGAELVTKKGRTIKFDSIECLLSYYKQASAAGDVESVWVADIRHPGVLIDANQAHFVDLGPGRAPMGRGWAAIADEEDAAAIGITDRAAVKGWSELL